MASDSEFNTMVDALQKQIMGDAARHYSAAVVEHFNNPRNVGVIPGTEAFAIITGACGDTMEIFMEIEAGVIRKAQFNTDGCMATIACGSCLTEMITGKPVAEAYALSAADLITALGGLPDDHRHCALLAVLTLYSALGRYSVHSLEG